jgi:hypothetical protein
MFFLQEHNALFFGIYFREFFSNPLLDFNGHSICLATNSLSVCWVCWYFNQLLYDGVTDK